MYLEKRKTGEGIKYFLAHSFREGEKIHKIRKLLGNDLDKKTLDERIKKIEKLILDEINKYRIIKNPLDQELSKEEIEFIKQLEVEAELRVIHLSEHQWELFSRSFVYSTNAIEGSKLTSREVNEILIENKWPDKSKQDIAEAYGVDEALKYIRNINIHLSIELIKEIHKIVFKNSKNFAGELRKKGQEVAVITSSGEIVHEGAPQTRVVSLLKELEKWYNKYKNKYPPILLAAVVHNQFETIHPFADGNGRVGRILLNNILIKHNLPPVNIDIKNQAEYYMVLNNYQKNQNIRPTIEFLLKEYKNLKNIIK